jgi:hypothetical protein
MVRSEFNIPIAKIKFIT